MPEPPAVTCASLPSADGMGQEAELSSAGSASVIGVIHFGTLQRLWDLFTAAVLNTAKFTIAAGVMTVVLGAIVYAEPIGPRVVLAAVVIIAGVLAILWKRRTA